MKTIEVFTAGCPLCTDTLKLIGETVKKCGCEIIEHRCAGVECCAEAKKYGIKAVPTIVVNGVIAYEGQPTRQWAKTFLKG